jgi:hypothetical protein
MANIGRLAYIVTLIGGLVMIILGIAGFIGMAFMSMFFMSPLLGFMGIGFGILHIVLGIIAIIGSKRATQTTWAVILIIVGLIGGGFGGVVVVLGGILGLLSKYIK